MSCDENRSKTTHNNIGNKVKDNHSRKCNLAVFRCEETTMI